MNNYLKDTEIYHADAVDAFAFTMACQELKLREQYMLLYIKQKSWWCPSWLYKWFISRFVVLAEFKKKHSL